MFSIFSRKTFLFLLLIAGIGINKPTNYFPEKEDGQTRTEWVKSAGRAFLISFLAGATSGSIDKGDRISRSGGAFCAVGANYLIGNLACRERYIPTQVVAGLLGFYIGSIFSKAGAIF